MTMIPNGPVSTRMLRDTIEDTRELLRAEMRMLADRLDRHERQLEQIYQRLNMPGRWAGGRLTSLIDRLLPIGVIAAVTYLIVKLG